MLNSETTSLTSQHQQSKNKLIVEYIDESELAPNYHDNYIVYRDEETNENYIIDYSQKYKYVIRKKQQSQQQSLNNNNNNNNLAKQTNNVVQSDVTDSDNDLQSFQQETRYIYSYVDQTELVLIDLSKLTVNKNDLLEEYYIVDPMRPNRFCVILQNNWSENESLPYISEEDVDFMNWIVNLEKNSNRKFIVDDRDNTRYYIIPTDYMKEFKESWQKFYKNRPNNNNNNNNDESESTVSRNPMIIEYVDEDELKTVDLLNVKIQKDESYNEYYIQDPTNINHRWIVLPSNWDQKNYGNCQHYYIYEDEVNKKSNVIYKDAQRRRFIVIKKTNFKLYLVPKISDSRQSFRFKWSQIDQNLKKQNFKENKKLKASKVIQTSSDSTNGKKIEIVELQGSPKSSKRHDSVSSNKSSISTRQRSASNDRAYEQQRLIPRVNNNDNSKIRMIDAIVNNNANGPSLNANKAKMSTQVNKQQRSNSSSNVIDDEVMRSASGRVKKSVYFNENVKVSDGGNNTIPIMAPLEVPLRFDRSFSPSARFQGQFPVRQEYDEQKSIGVPPPPVKPREVKPMNVRVEFTNIDRNPSAASSIESSNRSLPQSQAQQQQQQQQKPFNYLNNNSHNNRTQSGNTIVRIKQPGRPGHVIYTNSKQ